MHAAEELAPQVGTAPVCDASGVSRASALPLAPAGSAPDPSRRGRGPPAP